MTNPIKIGYKGVRMILIKIRKSPRLLLFLDTNSTHSVFFISYFRETKEREILPLKKVTQIPTG